MNPIETMGWLFIAIVALVFVVTIGVTTYYAITTIKDKRIRYSETNPNLNQNNYQQTTTRRAV